MEMPGTGDSQKISMKNANVHVNKQNCVNFLEKMSRVKVTLVRLPDSYIRGVVLPTALNTQVNGSSVEAFGRCVAWRVAASGPAAPYLRHAVDLEESAEAGPRLEPGPATPAWVPLHMNRQSSLLAWNRLRARRGDLRVGVGSAGEACRLEE